MYHPRFKRKPRKRVFTAEEQALQAQYLLLSPEEVIYAYQHSLLPAGRALVNGDSQILVLSSQYTVEAQFGRSEPPKYAGNFQFPEFVDCWKAVLEGICSYGGSKDLQHEHVMDALGHVQTLVKLWKLGFEVRFMLPNKRGGDTTFWLPVPSTGTWVSMILVPELKRQTQVA